MNSPINMLRVCHTCRQLVCRWTHRLLKVHPRPLTILYTLLVLPFSSSQRRLVRAYNKLFAQPVTNMPTTKVDTWAGIVILRGEYIPFD
jgi:hypothetical protein